MSPGTGAFAARSNLNATIAPTITDDTGKGYGIGSRWRNVTTGKEYACTDATVNAAVWIEDAADVTDKDSVQAAGAIVSKSNLSAVTVPTVNDDANSDYAVASRWFDIVNDKEYVCLDATVGAAVWIETTGTAGAVTVRKNSGSNIGTRPRLNFIEGSNITLAISDDAGSDEIDISITAAGYSHPSARQCITGNWAWASITGKPSTYPPSAHENSHESGGSDVLEFDSLADGSTYKKFLNTERTKLSGIETGADVTDATNVNAAGAVMRMECWVVKTDGYVVMGSLPANSYVIRTQIHVTELFNDSGIDSIVVGHLTDTDAYGTSITPTALGIYDPPAGVAIGYNASAHTIRAFYWGQNGDATTGKALVIIEYMKVTTQP